MTLSNFMALLPELVLLAGALAIFVICLGESRGRAAYHAALIVAVGAIAAATLAFGQETMLFDQAYRVDRFSQLLKLAFAIGFLLVLLAGGRLPDIRAEVQPEYFLLATLSVSGLMMLVSSVEIITLVVALELSSFPLYLMLPMRRERPEQRSQMESAVKYIMFGVTANGVMLFGLSYLFGLTGSTSLPEIARRIQPLLHSPLAITALAMTCCGFFFKLAVFPFHFWSPDIYQGAANETTGLIASLPKVGAVAVLVRFATIAAPDHDTIAWLLTGLALASMFYGNLAALAQNDLKRLLGFSAIAHAGYALIGLVALDRVGFTAALFYLLAYQFMVLACFVVICRVSRDGTNVRLPDLAGLHRRSPLLALTLVVGVFALAGIPPFAGFTGKLTLLAAALAKGHTTLVILAVVNTAVAAYYYLGVVRETCFREPVETVPILLDVPTRVLCWALVAATLLLGIAPARLLELIATSIDRMGTALPAP